MQITGIGSDLEQGIFTLAQVESEGTEEKKANGTANGTKPKDARSISSKAAGKKKK